MSIQNKKTAIFIMPRSSSAWLGAEAMWISTAGWAAAAKRKFGDAVVVTTDRVATPAEVLTYPLSKGKLKNKNKFVSFIPVFIKIFFKDLTTWKDTRNWKILKKLTYRKEDVAFVWEKHDLFTGPGRKFANKLEVPFISYVHAPVVWEAQKWGVNRYIWGQLLEKWEASSLKKADYVAVVSEEVKQKVIEMGVSPSKVFISPMAVDARLFSEKESEASDLRQELDLEGKFVIGWTGSFRSFHGVDHLILAFSKLSREHPELVLLLVGEGAEKKKCINLVLKLKLRDKIIFTGRKSFIEIPGYVTVFDLAVVSASSANGFHYSPLKLREYLAACKPVLAPNAGEIPKIFKDGVNLKLFEAGQIESLIAGMEFYISNPQLKEEISENGKKLALTTSTWEVELEKCMTFIQKYK